jgi:hypothetical protein
LAKHRIDPLESQGEEMKSKWMMVLALFAALPLMAQTTAVDRKPFQGNWLGWGCFDKNDPFAVSLSINDDTVTWRTMAVKDGVYTTKPAKDSHGTYQTLLDGRPGLIWDYSDDVHVVFRNGTERMESSWGGTKVKLSGGPDSDSESYADAHAHFCANFEK